MIYTLHTQFVFNVALEWSQISHLWAGQMHFWIALFNISDVWRVRLSSTDLLLSWQDFISREMISPLRKIIVLNTGERNSWSEWSYFATAGAWLPTNHTYSAQAITITPPGHLPFPCTLSEDTLSPFAQHSISDFPKFPQIKPILCKDCQRSYSLWIETGLTSSRPFNTNLRVKSNVVALTPAHAALPHHSPAAAAPLPRAFKTSPLPNRYFCYGPHQPDHLQRWMSGCLCLGEHEGLEDTVRLSRSGDETHLPPHCLLASRSPPPQEGSGEAQLRSAAGPGGHTNEQEQSSE